MNKRIIVIITIISVLLIGMFSCWLKLQTINTDTLKRITVIDCLNGDILYQMTGEMEVKKDKADNTLKITVKSGDETIVNCIGLCDNITYIIENIDLRVQDKYNITYNSLMEFNKGE